MLSRESNVADGKDLSAIKHRCLLLVWIYILVCCDFESIPSWNLCIPLDNWTGAKLNCLPYLLSFLRVAVIHTSLETRAPATSQQ